MMLMESKTVHSDFKVFKLLHLLLLSSSTLCPWTWASDFWEAVTQWREVALWALLSLCKRWSRFKKSLLALLKAWDKGSQPLMNCCNCKVCSGALQLLYTRWRRGCQRRLSSEVKGGSGKVFSPWSSSSRGGEPQQHLVWRGCSFCQRAAYYCTLTL